MCVACTESTASCQAELNVLKGWKSPGREVIEPLTGQIGNIDNGDLDRVLTMENPAPPL